MPRGQVARRLRGPFRITGADQDRISGARQTNGEPAAQRSGPTENSDHFRIVSHASLKVRPPAHALPRLLCRYLPVPTAASLSVRSRNAKLPRTIV